jgi:hypothetical protein
MSAQQKLDLSARMYLGVNLSSAGSYKSTQAYMLVVNRTFALPT